MQSAPHPLLVQLFAEAFMHHSQGNLGMALVAYRRVQNKFPEFVDAWVNASVVLFDMGRAQEALAMALRATEIGPDNPAALCALANAQQMLGQAGDAALNFQRAIALDPGHVPALTNLAGIYNREGRFAEAVALGDRAIQLQPSNSVLWANSGHAKLRAMDLAGAEGDLAKALELDGGNAQARWNLAYAQLLQGRYGEAWPNFGARRELAEWSGNIFDFGKPHWGGGPLDGRTLLVYSEQGFGDTLHFARFVPRLRQFGGNTMFLVSQPLQRLLANFPGIDGLAVEGEPLPEYDLVVPLMELPAILNVGPHDLAPVQPPPLPGGKAMAAIPELRRPGFKVGLVWAGSPIHTNDALRSMPPRCLDELADMQGIAWYGLQKPPAIDPPKLPGYIDLSGHIGDFMDTAQLIKQLDLVATVDTSVAHLAGFLDMPAAVLLAYLPDWRWGAQGFHSPWYPGLTLLRQPAHGDWRSVVGMLRDFIAGMAASKK